MSLQNYTRTPNQADIVVSLLWFQHVICFDILCNRSRISHSILTSVTSTSVSKWPHSTQTHQKHLTIELQEMSDKLLIVCLIMKHYLFIVKHAQIFPLTRVHFHFEADKFHYLSPLFLLASRLPHKQWFISAFVCHKLIYTLLWLLWATSPSALHKVSIHSIDSSLIFKSPGGSSFVLQSDSFSTWESGACCSLAHADRNTH